MLPESKLMLLTTHQAAEQLNISPSWLEHARLRREGPEFLKIGGKVLYRPIALEAWVLRLQEETLNPPRRPRGRPKKNQVHP